jgi:hypothetical protein
MITDYKIKKCMYLDTRALERAIQYTNPKDTIKESKFLGITNGKQFCYEILYFDQHLGEDCYTKVFVDLDCNEEPYAEY